MIDLLCDDIQQIRQTDLWKPLACVIIFVHVLSGSWSIAWTWTAYQPLNDIQVCWCLLLQVTSFFVHLFYISTIRCCPRNDNKKSYLYGQCGKIFSVGVWAKRETEIPTYDWECCKGRFISLHVYVISYIDYVVLLYSDFLWARMYCCYGFSAISGNRVTVEFCGT